MARKPIKRKLKCVDVKSKAAEGRHRVLAPEERELYLSFCAQKELASYFNVSANPSQVIWDNDSPLSLTEIPWGGGGPEVNVHGVIVKATTDSNGSLIISSRTCHYNPYVLAIVRTDYCEDTKVELVGWFHGRRAKTLFRQSCRRHGLNPAEGTISVPRHIDDLQ
jgi:hypothetical protein